jgi:hypothetical protein
MPTALAKLVGSSDPKVSSTTRRALCSRARARNTRLWTALGFVETLDFYRVQRPINSEVPKGLMRLGRHHGPVRRTPDRRGG